MLEGYYTEINKDCSAVILETWEGYLIGESLFFKKNPKFSYWCKAMIFYEHV